jgi:hypothetical protein
MIPLPMVAATFRWNTRKATKLKNAAHPTAACGVSTRVDTTVATELAASWKPLRKSNSSATAISSHTASGSSSHGTRPICSPAISRKCMVNCH